MVHGCWEWMIWMDRYGYCHTVSGERWMAWYLGHPERIEALKNNCKEAYYAGVKGPSSEPTVEVQYDEMWGNVRVYVEGHSVE